MQEEEIDLRKLYVDFKQTTFYKQLKNAILFIFRYNLWFVFFILVGAAAGYFYRSNLKADYRARIVASSELLDPKLVRELTPELNKSLSAEEVEISYSEQNNVLLVEKDPLIININSNEFYNFKKMNEEEIFIFDVKMKDSASFQSIEGKFLNFFESLPYYASLKKSNEQSLLKKEGILINEVAYIDSLLKTEDAGDQAALLAEKTKAHQHLLDLKRQMHNNHIIVINSKTLPEVEPNALHQYAILLFAFGFFIIGGLILWFVKH